MDHVDIDEAALSTLRSADPEQPVTLLNLVRFREHALDGFGVDGFSGIEAFEQYATLTGTEGVDYAATVTWMGRAAVTIVGGERWDMGILVSYPTRQHFLDKMSDPRYQAIAGIRIAALADSRLIEFT